MADDELWTPIEGLCFDCVKCEEGFCGDWEENIWCPHRKEDGSCWDGGDGDV